MRGGFNPVVAGTAVVLVTLHFVLRVGFGLGGWAPDLLVLALLLSARELRAGSAAGAGLLLGVLEGAVVPASMGAAALALTLLGYAGARTRSFFSDDNPVLYALYLFAGKWLYDALLYLFSLLHGYSATGIVSALLFISPFAALYLAIVGMAVLAAQRALA
ncbi:MAG: hypothetical protein ACREKN_06720 [Longimicrobiaceae bacterium]